MTDTGTETPLRTYGYGYDLAGNQTSATSPEGHVTQQTFDALSRLTSLIEPVSASQSIITSSGYDATGAAPGSPMGGAMPPGPATTASVWWKR
ncbi:hypothetical protein [Nonomuraea jabiensis]|uniref:hypothetical protein n=1 Tax=Nonomuraea jabiensis TaxID=882448 RepID=UPI003D7291AB